VEIGVRELRSNLSRYLEDAQGGTAITVTHHGRPITRGVSTGERGVDLMMREGRVTPATKPRRPFPRPIRAKGTVSDLISNDGRG
jgi:prevent-host-death family protein